MLLQLLFVLVAIIVGARLGGIGLGVMGGVGPVSYTHLKGGIMPVIGFFNVFSMIRFL